MEAHCLQNNGEAMSASNASNLSACTGDPARCSCVIDTSTQETLERDFRRWLSRNSFATKRPTAFCAMTRAPTIARKFDGRKVMKTGEEPGFQQSGILQNTLGRLYYPGRPLGMEERRLIVECHSRGMKVSFISKSLCVSHGCVSKIINRYCETGVLEPLCVPTARRSYEKKRQEVLNGSEVESSNTSIDDPFDPSITNSNSS